MRELRTQPYTTFTMHRKADDGSADHAPICHKLGRPDHNSTSPSKFNSKHFLGPFSPFFLIAKISSLAENEPFSFSEFSLISRWMLYAKQPRQAAVTPSLVTEIQICRKEEEDRAGAYRGRQRVGLVFREYFSCSCSPHRPGLACKNTHSFGDPGTYP